MFEKDSLQELVSKIINLNTSHRLIGNLAKTACNRHAASVTNYFAKALDEKYRNEEEYDSKEEDDDDNKRREGKIAVHYMLKQSNK